MADNEELRAEFKEATEATNVGEYARFISLMINAQEDLMESWSNGKVSSEEVLSFGEKALEAVNAVSGVADDYIRLNKEKGLAIPAEIVQASDKIKDVTRSYAQLVSLNSEILLEQARLGGEASAKEPKTYLPSP